MGDNSWAHRSGPSGQDYQHANWVAAARKELSAILACDHFKRAPKLEQLLSYLVAQTLDGKGDKLKSYVVGVDGLGKDPDFDPNIDSYPRVQVLRLRKMLEAYYARHETDSGMCLYIPSGSYGVRLARRTKAYPELIGASGISRLPAPNPATLFAAPEMGAASLESSLAPKAQKDPIKLPDIQGRPLEHQRSRSLWGLIALLVLLAGLTTGYFLRRADGQLAKPLVSLRSKNSPVMLVEKPGASPDPSSQAIAEEAYANLADSIGRSWVVRLRLDEPGDISAGSRNANYRLAVQLGEPQVGQRPLYLRLTDSRTDDFIWSGTARIDPARSLSDNLGKSIVQLAGPFGVIATRETRRTGGKYTQGYTCLLGYIDVLKSQDVNLRAQRSDCLNTSIGHPRLDAVRLGLLSFHVVETAPPSRRPMAVVEARSLAQRAIRLDPKEAYAHFAMARIFFVTGNCEMGILHTRHAAEANPYDPILLAVLGDFASFCGDVDGDRLLARAFELRSPGESYARLPLILAAIRNGKTDQLPSLSAEPENIPGMNVAYHYLCETLIAAASGDQQTARAQWQKFSAVSAAPNGTPDEMMQRVVLSPQVRERIVTYLQSKDVLPNK